MATNIICSTPRRRRAPSSPAPALAAASMMPRPPQLIASGYAALASTYAGGE